MTTNAASSTTGTSAGEPNAGDLNFAASAEQAAANITPLRKDFFARLFDQHPHIKDLFGANTIGQQKQMFEQILEAATLCGEDGTEWLSDHLAMHTAKHEDAGVTNTMYDEVTAAFVETLASFHADAWNDTLAAEWHRRLTWVSNAMRA